MNDAQEVQRSLGRIEGTLDALQKKMDEHVDAQKDLMNCLRAHLNADEIRFSAIERQQTVAKTVVRTLVAVCSVVGGAQLVALIKAIRDGYFS